MGDHWQRGRPKQVVLLKKRFTFFKKRAAQKRPRPWDVSEWCAFFRKRSFNILHPFLILLTPPPPPPLQGRGVPTEFQVADKAAAAPLPCRGGAGGGVSIFILSYSMVHQMKQPISAPPQFLIISISVRCSECSVLVLARAYITTPPFSQPGQFIRATKRKTLRCGISNILASCLVGVPGLEPGKAGPESAVLPLHHTPMPLQPNALFVFAGAKVLLFLELPKFFGEKL